MAGAAKRTVPIYQMGKDCLAIEMKLHMKNRERLCHKLNDKWKTYIEKKQLSKQNASNVFILLQGGTEISHGGSDCDVDFRQESFFHWAFGGLEPDWYGGIELATGKSTIFVPKLPESAIVVMGQTPTPELLKTIYAVDECCYTEQIESWFKDKKAELILTLYGLNTDSKAYTTPAYFPGIEAFTVNKDILHPEMVDCRVHKTEEELAVMRYACRISSAAHREVLQASKPGMYEYQVESLVKHHCHFNGGMRFLCYTGIVASGANGAILHYGHAGAPNESQFTDGAMCVLDMGGEYYCYCSDITTSFPVNGKFTPDQKLVYQTVLDASRAVIARLKPGVVWEDLDILAERHIVMGLSEGGLLRGDVDEMMTHSVGSMFMPHGLGHLIGVDTHDVGGVRPGVTRKPRNAAFGPKNLRLIGPLEENMVLTVEPGCYFIDVLLDKALKDPKVAKFLVPEVLQRFRGTGGVRIEENILITKTGCEVFTDVPRDIVEIEALMAKKSTTSA